MKLETAYKQIRKEADFLGLSIEDTLIEIAEQGPMVFSKRSVEAFVTVIQNSRTSVEEFSPYETINS